MKSNEIRKGITQALYNKNSGNIFVIESVLIGGIFGVIFKSVSIGIISLFGFVMFISFLATFKVLNIMLNLILSSIWGISIGAVCYSFQTPIISAILIGLIIFALSWMSRARALQHIADIVP